MEESLMYFTWYNSQKKKKQKEKYFRENLFISFIGLFLLFIIIGVCL